MQGREDKYFINMCRWIYGLACHSSTSCFQFCPWQVCLLPTENHTFSFSALCGASNTGALFLLKPILSCSVTPKTDSTWKKIKILCQLYRNSWVMIKKVRDSFPWGTKISRREGYSILEAVLCHLNLVLPWEWGELEQDWEGTGSRGPLWMDSVTYLSFSYQKNRCKEKKKNQCYNSHFCSSQTTHCWCPTTPPLSILDPAWGGRPGGG